jgi:hypothetical protein
MVWSSGDLIPLYRRQSSANSLVVDGKLLIKSRNIRGPRNVLVDDVWPSSTTCWLVSRRKLVIQSL